MNEWEKHHIWCNYFMHPAEGCAMCKGLNERYPMDGKTPDALLAEHFPDARART